MEPKEITENSVTKEQFASFNYYDGIEYAKSNCMKHTTKLKELKDKKHFLVCCGDVMIKVDSNDFPHIKRRIL